MPDIAVEQAEACRVAYNEALNSIVAQERTDMPDTMRKLIAEAREAQQALKVT